MHKECFKNAVGDDQMSNRKRICVITAQVEESTQNRFMQGFLKQAYDMNYDVCIFSMFLKYQDSTYREVGDSNIYNLINFNLFVCPRELLFHICQMRCTLRWPYSHLHIRWHPADAPYPSQARPPCSRRCRTSMFHNISCRP